MDAYKIIATVIATLSIGFNVFQYTRKKPRLRFQLGYGYEINDDEEGTYLAAKVFISNIGGAPAIYNGLEGRDSKGEVFFPSTDKGAGQKIEPNDSLILAIPQGHLLTHGVSSLWVVDGVFTKHEISKKALGKLLSELKNEKDRLEALGLKVNPPSLFERRNKRL